VNAMVETYRGAVYPWHCDHMGHMNVMWYVGKFVHEMRDAHGGEIAAVCVLTAVHMDSKTRKSASFPAEFVARGRDLLCSYETRR
jgi:acyl-CoA thioesterase FadM